MELNVAQLIKEGIAAHKAGRLQDADRIYTSILKDHPNHPDANHNMGVLAVGVGKIYEALPFFKKALEANPKVAQFYLSYINALIKLDQMVDARAVFDRAKDNGAKGDLYDQLEKRLEALEPVLASANKCIDPPQNQIQPIINLYIRDELQKALDAASCLLQHFPNSVILHNIQGATNTDLGYFAAAIISCNKSLSIKPDQAEAYINMGSALKGQKKINEAIVAYRQAINLRPDYADAHYNLAVLFQSQTKLDEAISAYKKVTTLRPDYPEAYNNLGISLHHQAKLDEAISAYKKAINLRPDYAEAYNNLGISLHHQAKLDEAIATYKKAITLRPEYAEAYNNLGNAHKDQGKFDEAVEVYKKAISLKPNYANSYYNLGIALEGQAKLDDAIAAYKQAITIRSGYAEAYFNIAIILKDQRKLDEAVEVYKKAISLKPCYIEAYNNLGNALYDQGKLDEALDALMKALSLKPDYAAAYKNIGNILKNQGKLDKAIDAYDTAFTSKNNFYPAYSSAVQTKAEICAWEEIRYNPLEDYFATSLVSKVEYPMPPFQFLHSECSPENHLRLAKIYAANTFQNKRPNIITKPRSKPKQLRVGYFSPDFRDHPVAKMVEGLFRYHDRNKFEIYAYSFCKTVDFGWQKKIRDTVQDFKNFESKSIREIISLVREDLIDIAIDLTGYTQNARTEIFHQRVAPIQINYLGYPGTMGADFIDYIIADRTVIPQKMERFYSEKVIFMPNTYQPTNDSLVISKDIPSKEALSLPPNAFIFCAINQGYKIKPLEFDIWMRLLGKVEDSVLWLKSANDYMRSNLEGEASKRGVDPSRLIFTKHVPDNQYLAQFKHADLYLDTFNYNAGTTASDILMAGLPIVTKMGNSYASRMAASLLNACSMNDLITETPQEYENLAFELAINPKKLKKIKKRIEKNTKTSSIFDIKLYTHHLEAGYQQAYDLYHSGSSIQNIMIKKDHPFSKMDPR